MSQTASNEGIKKFKEYEPGKVVEVLTNLNYPIQDFGDFIRTKALYRGGDGINTLKVWKNSGWCVDYAEDRKGFSLYDLIAKTLGTQNPKNILSLINSERKEFITAPKPKYLMAKTYDKSCLERLLPNYSFYEKRGISAATQKMYRMGYATKDQMYQRLTFPIFNENDQIVGFSGRHIYAEDKPDTPKWKHIGRKDSFVYPFYTLPKREIGENITLIESIGDSMALTENGLLDHAVTFGLDCSPTLLSFLLKIDPAKITISTNNDDSKEINRGKIAAIKTMVKLSSVFPVDMLEIKLPTQNDLSDMQKDGQNLLDWHKNGAILPKSEIMDTINQYREKFQADKLGKFLKKYECGI